MAFLSVLLPVYNGQDLVGQAIESVLGQPCADLELIILNDGSTDKTQEICMQFEKADSRIKLFSHENVGIGRTRNMGMKYLTGQYTIFLDHDDIIVPDFYTEAMRDFLQKCMLKNIELIVPARIRTDYGMQYAKLDRVSLNGVVDGGNEPSWCIPYEFATIIYSTTLLKTADIQFSETRPEMESIFRHKAAYCATKILFTNDLYFAVRRENTNSIVYNWNYEKVFLVSLQEYCQLIEWHKNVCMDYDAIYHCIEYIESLIRNMIFYEIKSNDCSRSVLHQSLFLEDTKENELLYKYFNEYKIKTKIFIIVFRYFPKELNSIYLILRKVKKFGKTIEKADFEDDFKQLCILMKKECDNKEKLFLLLEKRI